MYKVQTVSFSSPIGESIFSTRLELSYKEAHERSRPLSGNLFSLLI